MGSQKGALIIGTLRVPVKRGYVARVILCPVSVPLERSKV